MKGKVLVCGGKGQLGVDCTRVLDGQWAVTAMDLDELDITDREAVFGVVEDLDPDVVLNCAAYTQVDQCETDADNARRVNALGPGFLAQAAAERRATLIHISTDYVFDGLRPPPWPYMESDAPAPLSVYGRTKLEGEEAVRDALGRHMILRTAWLYGAHGPNFLKTMLRLSLSSPQRVVKVVNDQFGCPTWSEDLARQIARLMEAGGTGTYHVCGEGFCSWYELAVYFLHKMGAPHNLVRCSTEEYPTAAVRPRNSILENRRLKDEGILVMRHWREAVDAFVSTNRTVLMQEAGR